MSNPSPGAPSTEQSRRWRLALGGSESSDLSSADQRMDAALSALYGAKRRAGLGSSAPKVAKWLGDIREFFPSSVVQVIQRDAFERLNLRAMLFEPELLASLEADVHLVADLISLRAQMPDKAKATARIVVQKVVSELLDKLAQKTTQTLRGAIQRGTRSKRPRFQNIDWTRTLGANLRHWQAEYQTIVPETLIGHSRKRRNHADIDQVLLCVDQSGSMASSVVYASIFAAVMASLPALAIQLVCFDTAIVDLTEQLADPVDVLFGVQLGGGTDIHAALSYCERYLQRPSRCHLVLISDLYEGGDSAAMLARVAEYVNAGVQVIVLLALSDEGQPSYDQDHARAIAAMGCAVFACTPDQFPDLMACALSKSDVVAWAANQNIALVR
jgi:Mg-chelatase subunit ChlD